MVLEKWDIYWNADKVHSDVTNDSGSDSIIQY